MKKKVACFSFDQTNKQTDKQFGTEKVQNAATFLEIITITPAIQLIILFIHPQLLKKKI